MTEPLKEIEAQKAEYAALRDLFNERGRELEASRAETAELTVQNGKLAVRLELSTKLTELLDMKIDLLEQSNRIMKGALFGPEGAAPV